MSANQQHGILETGELSFQNGDGGARGEQVPNETFDPPCELPNNDHDNSQHVENEESSESLYNKPNEPNEPGCELAPTKRKNEDQQPKATTVVSISDKHQGNLSSPPRRRRKPSDSFRSF